MSHGTLEDMGDLVLALSHRMCPPFGCTLKYEQNGGYVTGEIKKEGYQIDDIFKRDNGVINVNYSKTSKSSGIV